MRFCLLLNSKLSAVNYCKEKQNKPVENIISVNKKITKVPVNKIPSSGKIALIAESLSIYMRSTFSLEIYICKLF